MRKNQDYLNRIPRGIINIPYEILINSKIIDKIIIIIVDKITIVIIDKTTLTIVKNKAIILIGITLIIVIPLVIGY